MSTTRTPFALGGLFLLNPGNPETPLKELSIGELLKMLQSASGKGTVKASARKDYKSVEDLVALLETRGLELADREATRHHLTTVGHHRLTAFYKAFYIAEKRFDTSIPVDGRDITDLYSFDRRLRLLLLGPLEKVEVALRSLIIKETGDYLLAQGRNPAIINLFHKSLYDLPTSQEKRNYDAAMSGCRKGAWNSWAAKFAISTEGRAISRILSSPDATEDDKREANTQRQRLFSEYYAELPAWQILQSASFGPLANIFSVLRREIATNIARHFQLPRVVLTTTFYALKELRNSCAHHEPIWNWDARYRSTALFFPKAFLQSAQIGADNRYRIYAYCAIIHILLSFLSHGHSTWFRRLKKLINEFNTTYGEAMGFPTDWQNLPFWCVARVEEAATYEGRRSRVSQYKLGIKEKPP